CRAGWSQHSRSVKAGTGLGGRFPPNIQFACRAGDYWLDYFLFRHRFRSSFCAGHQQRLRQVGL
ncbi:MAG: hypothetical protein VX928_05635, partial [Pseudomonadota bacterium]|nr:hypothetical protein [Pseudomonadota bacterium]